MTAFCVLVNHFRQSPAIDVKTQTPTLHAPQRTGHACRKGFADTYAACHRARTTEPPEAAKPKRFGIGRTMIRLDDTTYYRGYTVEATPRQIADDQWDTLFFIGRNSNGDLRMRGFLLAVRCRTRTEAVGICQRAARDIIDGNAQGMRVDDL